ncbi:MAG: cell division protein SepF [Nostocoides sp.]
MSALRKTMVYLGLADEAASDEYGYDYDEPMNGYEEPNSGHRAEVTPLRPVRASEVVHSPDTAGVSRITTIHPRTYNEAKTIGEAFRAGTPVIMNLSDMSDADAKRLVDFAAGLVFGLHGSIERVTAKVFLLSPSYIEVTGDEAAAAGHALFNQS